MDLPTALLDDLLYLGDSVGSDDNELGTRLAGVVQAMLTAVPSYQGLDLTVYEHDRPVNLAAFLDTDDGVITTSLRLPFAALRAGLHREGRLVFYAATPGAFVDLAADLGHVLQAAVVFFRPGLPAIDVADGDGNEPGHRDGHRSIVLDADLPPRTRTSGLTGLDEMSTINRAIGMLVDQGHLPDEAHHTLRRHAAAAGVEPHIYAARLLKG